MKVAGWESGFLENKVIYFDPLTVYKMICLTSSVDIMHTVDVVFNIIYIYIYVYIYIYLYSTDSTVYTIQNYSTRAD
jgi:hypothetical protein